ncbi:MAG: ribosome biogenesis GTPase Der [Phycisphaerae bacterium]
MPLPCVVIVGRPNVGKSSLLNALAKERVSIVDPRAGITRDRVGVVIEHDERFFELLDTGGIGIVDEDRLEAHVEEQIEFAIQRADLVLFLCDVRDGIATLDRAIAERLRRTQRPVIVVVNKVDVETLAADAAAFESFGFGEPARVSCKHYRGLQELLERIGGAIEATGERPAAPVMKLAIVGKRNAGKSTLVNALAGEARMIVSETPGTTRDAVDVRFERDGRVFVAIDTAGVRKRARMDDIDFYSYTRALSSIRRADVVAVLIDAETPVSEVDLKLVRAVLDEHKPLLLALNKWDLVKDRAEVREFSEYFERVMPQIDFAPLVCLTAKSGKNVDRLVDVASGLFKQAHTRVTTGRLNAVVEEILGERAPSARKGGKLPKIYYAAQVSAAPPTFAFFCNDPALIAENYRRFLENRLRQRLPVSEIPLRLLFRARRRGRVQSSSAGSGDAHDEE